MTDKIHPSIEQLAMDINLLMPLEGNPRIGNVDAIAASYEEFGQVKPIVVRPNDDGTATVIAGNHQLQAAKRLGWTRIAVVQMEADNQRALAFALADNRTNELGHTETQLLDDILAQISGEYQSFLTELGWDEFELASVSEHADRIEAASNAETGYLAPVIVTDWMDKEENDLSSIGAEMGDNGVARMVANDNVDTSKAITTGITSLNGGGASKAVVQYTLVFDDSDQQRKWYDFVRFLKSSPVYGGDTTAQRLIEFIEAHSDFS
jgi:hypothetical protein